MDDGEDDYDNGPAYETVKQGDLDVYNAQSTEFLDDEVMQEDEERKKMTEYYLYKEPR